MADPQKVSAHLIYFCDLPDLANLRFLFSAKWSRHKIFSSHFFFKLDTSSLECREKNHNNKKKRSEFFLIFWPREMRGSWISFVCVFCWRIWLINFFELFGKVNSFLNQKKWFFLIFSDEISGGLFFFWYQPTVQHVLWKEAKPREMM